MVQSIYMKGNAKTRELGREKRRENRSEMRTRKTREREGKQEIRKQEAKRGRALRERKEHIKTKESWQIPPGVKAAPSNYKAFDRRGFG